MNRVVRWFRPTATDPDLAHRQYLLNVIVLGLAIPGFGFGVIMLILWIAGVSPVIGAIAGLGVQPFYLFSFWLGRKGRVTIAAYIPVIVVFLAMAGSVLQVGVGHVSTVGFAMVVVTAGILIGPSAAVLFTGLSVISYIAGGWAQQSGFIPQALPPIETVIVDAVGLGLGLAVLVVFNWISNREIQRALDMEREMTTRLTKRREELEKEVEERTHGLERRALLLEITAEIGKLTTQMLAPQDLMARAVDVIKEQFNLYHASIFMLDEAGAWANLVASTGEAGRRLLARKHRLAVGSASVIGWVTANRSARITQNVEQDPFYFPNPLLPDTRSEMAVPLIVGQKMLGAMDVQSEEEGAFSEIDARAIQAITDELAFAIENARLLRSTQEQLQRFESSYREQARLSWSRLTQNKESRRILFGIDEEREVDPFETSRLAAGARRNVISDDKREMSAPVQVRGEVIATISVRRSQDSDPWSEDDRGFLDAVATQTALSLESARQFADERRRVAELEVVNRVSQAVSQHLRLDTLYRVVHSQVNQVLGDVDMLIGLFDATNNDIRFPYASEQREMLRLESTLLGTGLASLVIQTQQPLLLQEDTARRAKAMGIELKRPAAESWLGVPLLVGDDVIGLIAVQDYQNENRFTEDDAALLTTIASQVATALQNAQLMEQVQRTARRERLIHEITSKVRRAPDMKTVLETTVHELRRALNASGTNIRIGGETQPKTDPEGNNPDAKPEHAAGGQES